MLGAGCYASTNVTTNTNTASTNGNSVSMINQTFSPSSLTVAKGTTVTWTNNDSYDHKIVADTTGGPNSPQNIPARGIYQFTFDTPGTFNYHCSIHGTMMSGSVTVTE